MEDSNYIPKVNELCANCIYIMQTEWCMCCGHNNAKQDGNGRYIYPPAKWLCDIGEFNEAIPTISFEKQMELTAKQNGWVEVRKTESRFGVIIHYKKQ